MVVSSETPFTALLAKLDDAAKKNAPVPNTMSTEDAGGKVRVPSGFS